MGIQETIAAVVGVCVSLGVLGNVLIAVGTRLDVRFIVGLGKILSGLGTDVAKIARAATGKSLPPKSGDPNGA